MEAAAASTEIWVLGWSVVLLIVHILVQALSLDLSGDFNIKYLLSSRDEGLASKSVISGRLKRSLDNMLETYPAFIALALALAVTGKTGELGAVGAVTWILARLVYAGLYVGGVPVLRTIVWFVSIGGLVLMVVRLMT
ncbi:putative MAPEG superfamily protein [Aminobacter lissarensis]|uniref:MAPEG superfamily protein n=1 Tax=Aminobacter carboxidus TaxID=376165 RepID=A0A8E1WE55_9HYPH|nr:MAPEG family protein [Aminobacter lissarensis]MBB6465762.1 putative MAPEG superfamily protein [Aminobacter lissarensis]